MPETNNNLLEVEDLKTYFPIRKGLLRRTVGYVKAVDGVSFNIQPGQTLGLVGESGCGKTTVVRTIVRLEPATAGKITFNCIDVLQTRGEELRKLRGDISVIFQDPYGSLNPRMTVGGIVAEPLKVHKTIKDSELNDRLALLLQKVGLSADHINRYPHEFSGGQRQRIGIARALALNPKLVICDEPVSALDVSIQSQILNLLKDLQQDFGLTYLFIAHNLAVVQYVSDFVAVMYLGKIVEYAGGQELYENPLHPYSRALISAIPQVEPASRGGRARLTGEMPASTRLGEAGSDAARPPASCPFHPRCPLAEVRCSKEPQKLEQKDEVGRHFVACWKSL